VYGSGSAREEPPHGGTQLFEDVNGRIREVAGRLDPRSEDDWEFVCECGDAGCREHLSMPLPLYDDLKKERVPLIAQGHPFEWARRTRARAAALQQDAVALRNQAQVQRSRLERALAHQLERAFSDYFFEPRLEFECSSCSYGIRARELPEQCPMCHARDWRPRRPPRPHGR